MHLKHHFLSYEVEVAPHGLVLVLASSTAQSSLQGIMIQIFVTVFPAKVFFQMKIFIRAM